MADAHGGQPEPAPGQRVIVLGFDEATWEKTLKFFHENARQANDYLQIIHVVGLRDTPQSSLTSHEPVVRSRPPRPAPCRPLFLSLPTRAVPRPPQPVATHAADQGARPQRACAHLA